MTGKGGSYYSRKKAEGKCVHGGCQELAVSGRVRCSAHAVELLGKRAERYKAARASGVCVYAGCSEGVEVNPRTGKPYAYCSRHRAEVGSRSAVGGRRAAAVSGGAVTVGGADSPRGE